MLTTDLYSFEITGHDPGHEISARILLNENSSVYAGHFPGFPVTPGVCQVLMIKEILVEVLDIPLQLSKAKDIKFNSVHEPGKVSTIQGRIKYERVGQGTINVAAQLFDGNTKYLSFRGEFGEYE
jgi:3-hydroxyacyl-[acyl-carrier-protein] dehydratase